MLAYLFWHRPKPEVTAADYEKRLLGFSRALAGSGCKGVRAASNFQISAVPWLDDGPSYEDWVIVDGPEILGTLNTVAVSGAMAVPHANVAQAMEIGHGGLHYHLWGELDPQAAEEAQWLTRPRGIDFRPVLEEITRSAGQPVSVWRRFMVLGPGWEFLILGRQPLALRVPPGWTQHAVRRNALGGAE